MTDRVQRVRAWLQYPVAAQVFPGAAFAFGTSDWVEMGAVGHLDYAKDAEPVLTSTLYDLASLTKVIVTTTSAMFTHAEEVLDLEQPVDQLLPEFRGDIKSEVRIKHLLEHNSGLPAHRELWLRGLDRSKTWQSLLMEPLEAMPGERTLYSCLGFLVLQQVLQLLSAEVYETAWAWPFFRLDAEWGTEFQFNPPASLRHRIAPTERVPKWLHFEGDASNETAVLRGKVHDENCRFLGGVTGNAGLFGTIHDISRFAQWVLRKGEGRVDSGLFDLWTSRRLVADSTATRALGWDTKSPGRSSAGTRIGPRAFGHTGFTGTSLWFDPDQELFVALLTNRVHPNRETGDAILNIRGGFADLVISLMNDV